jgi:small subunit ribosomal protein S6
MVIDSFVKSEDMQNLLNKIQNFIKNNGGEIRKVEEWGKKRLAYEINRKQYGNYFHIVFEGPSSLPQLLEREYRMEESILRYLTVLTDAKTLEVKEEKSAADIPEEISPEPLSEDSIPEEDLSLGADDQETKEVVDEEVKESTDVAE